MKIFKCYYYFHSRGSGEEIVCLVKSETITTVIGLMLDTYPETYPSGWTITEFTFEDNIVYQMTYNET